MTNTITIAIGTDGTGFSLLHEFAGGVNDGSYPCGSLILDGSTIYGMTNTGGDTNHGVIFSSSLLAIDRDFNGDGKSDVLAENSSVRNRYRNRDRDRKMNSFDYDYDNDYDSDYDSDYEYDSSLNFHSLKTANLAVY